MEEVYAWFPIRTLIDNEVLVTYDWVSNSKDLNLLHHLERNKMKYVLMSLISIDGDQDTDLKRNKVDTPQGVRTDGSLSEPLKHEWWEQVFNIVWRDPRGKRGCIQTHVEKGGCYCGPDITSQYLYFSINASGRCSLGFMNISLKGMEFDMMGRLLVYFLLLIIMKAAAIEELTSGWVLV